MILGRNKGLWLALLGASLNAAVFAFGVQLSIDQVVALNGLGLALIGIVANESDPSTVATFAASTGK